MIRSNNIKNFLYVLMIVTCYMSVRLTLIQIQSQSNELSSEPEVQPRVIADTTPPTTKPFETTQLDCGSEFLGTPDSILERDHSYKDVTCSALIYSPSDKAPVYTRATKFQNSYPALRISEDVFINSTRNCKKFQASHGYHLKPVNDEERDFPIAYNILTHRDIQQVERVLRAIYRPQNVYCFHIDDKQKKKFKEAIKSLANCFPNVYVASKLEKIVYAGFSRLQADINCMSDQLKQPIKWKYLLNIAAQSFPVRTNLEMVRILRVYNGSNDIEGIYGRRKMSGRYYSFNWRYVYEWKESLKNGTIFKSGKKNPPPPNDIDIVKGSAYGIFSRDFVHYMLHDDKAKALLEWSRYTFSPDEHYWATLHHTYANPHLHPPGGFRGKPDSKPWLAVWVAWGRVDPCHGRFKRATCVFGVADLPMLTSRREFFVNKFYFDYQPLVLECLNNWLEFKVKCQPPMDMKYYQNLPFINKAS